jgi:hypothetical protein
VPWVAACYQRSWETGPAFESTREGLMDQPTTWQVTVVTPGKIYKGSVFAGSSFDRRTISLLNSNSKTSKYTDTTLALEGFLQMDDVMLSVGGSKKGFSTVAIKKSEIIFAMDEFRTMGSESERKRYESWKKQDEIIQVSIITKLRAGQSFQLSGTVHQFKQKFIGKDNFLPMVEVSIVKLVGKQGEAVPPTGVPFAAVNKNHIECITLVERDYRERAL